MLCCSQLVFYLNFQLVDIFIILKTEVEIIVGLLMLLTPVLYIDFSKSFLHTLRVLQVQDFLLAQILLRKLTMVFIIQVWLLSLEVFQDVVRCLVGNMKKEASSLILCSAEK